MITQKVIYEVDPSILRISYPKICHCCKRVHNRFPNRVKYQTESCFYYFNCVCGSTLVIRARNIIKLNQEGKPMNKQALDLLMNKFWPVLTDQEKAQVLDKVQEIQQEPFEIEFLDDEHEE